MRYSKKTMPAVAVIAAAFLTATTVATMPNMAYADDNNGLIVPMYGWDAGWSQVIDAKEKNPSTEIIVVINPSSGPGGSKDSHWTNVVDDLQDADIKVAGYVATSYAGRSVGDVKDDIDKYDDWYGVDAIFLDEVSPSALDYYKELNDHAGSLKVILNPGAPVPSSYGSAGDIIVAYENFGIPSDVSSNGIGESKLAALPHGLEPDEASFKEHRGSVGYLYVSPDWMHVASSIEDQANWAD